MLSRPVRAMAKQQFLLPIVTQLVGSAPRFFGITAPQDSEGAIKTKRQTRKIAERQRRKARRRADSIARHRDGEKARARALSQQDADKAALQAVINAMTNHERHCWSRHCGNDRKKRTDIAVARRFQTPLVQLLRAAVSRIDPAAVHP